MRKRFSAPAVISAWAVVAFVTVDQDMANTIDRFIDQLTGNMLNLGPFIPALVFIIEAYMIYRYSYVKKFIYMKHPQMIVQSLSTLR